MTKRISLLNGANENQDYDFLQFQNETLTNGVFKANSLLCQEQTIPDSTIKINAGICLIDVIRVSDSNKSFKLHCESNSDENLAITGTPGNIGAVIAFVPKTSIEDGTSNSMDGQGVFDFEYIEGLSGTPLTDGEINTATGNLYYWIRLANIEQAATITNSEIIDSRDFVSIENIESLSVNEIHERTTGNGVAIDGVKMKDGYFEIPEQADTPSTPTENKWKIYPKSDGLYILDDLGNEIKILAGVVPSVFEIEAGEDFPNHSVAVRIGDDGKAYLAHGTAHVQESTSGPDITTAQKIISKKIDTNKYLFIYVNSNTLSAIIGTIASGVWTMGTPVTISSTFSSALEPHTFDTLGSSKFVVTWKDSVSNEIKGKCFSISGVTITAGAEVVVVTNSSTPVQPCVCFIQETGIGVILYGWNYQSISDVYVRAATLTGVTQTLGLAVGIDFSAASSSYPRLKRSRENEALLIFQDSDNTVDYVTISQTFNLSTIVANSIQTTGLSFNLGTSTLERINDDKFIFLHFDAPSGAKNIDCHILSVSGSSISISNPQRIHSYDGTIQDVKELDGCLLFKDVNNANKFIVFKPDYKKYPNAGLYQYNENPVVTAAIGLIDTSGSDPSLKWTGIDVFVGEGSWNSPFCIAQEDNEVWIYLIFPVVIDNIGSISLARTKIIINFLIGFNNTSAALGETLNINLNEATNLSSSSHANGESFIPGQVYYTSADGKFIDSPELGGFLAMRAVTTNRGIKLF